MRTVVLKGVVAVMTALCCLASASGDDDPTNHPAMSGATNGISVTVEIKDGRRKTVTLPPNLKPTALVLVLVSGVSPFCSHDYGGEHILRMVPGKGEVKIPFDLRGMAKGGSDRLDVELLDKDTVVLPHMRGGIGFGPPQNVQQTNAPYSDPAALFQKR